MDNKRVSFWKKGGYVSPVSVDFCRKRLSRGCVSSVSVDFWKKDGYVSSVLVYGSMSMLKQYPAVIYFLYIFAMFLYLE